jgi:hypothetical protein
MVTLTSPDSLQIPEIDSNFKDPGVENYPEGFERCWDAPAYCIEPGQGCCEGTSSKLNPVRPREGENRLLRRCRRIAKL